MMMAIFIWLLLKRKKSSFYAWKHHGTLLSFSQCAGLTAGMRSSVSVLRPGRTCPMARALMGCANPNTPTLSPRHQESHRRVGSVT